MTLIEIIHARLQMHFSPSELKVLDESHLHIGHAGSAEGGKHIKLIISSSFFKGEPLQSIHRKIYAVLIDLMPSAIHALQIKIIPS